MFVMLTRLIIPYTFTVGSHIIVTVSLALLVFFIEQFYVLRTAWFFSLFVPSGVPTTFCRWWC